MSVQPPDERLIRLISKPFEKGEGKPVAGQNITLFFKRVFHTIFARESYTNDAKVQERLQNYLVNIKVGDPVDFGTIDKIMTALESSSLDSSKMEQTKQIIVNKKIQFAADKALPILQNKIHEAVENCPDKSSPTLDIKFYLKNLFEDEAVSKQFKELGLPLTDDVIQNRFLNGITKKIDKTIKREGDYLRFSLPNPKIAEAANQIKEEAQQTIEKELKEVMATSTDYRITLNIPLERLSKQNLFQELADSPENKRAILDRLKDEWGGMYVLSVVNDALQIETHNPRREENIRRLEEELARKEDASIAEFVEENPYIHGTTSAILYQLPRTDQKILSVWDLTMKRLAPIIGGEVELGGLETPNAKGETSFGRLVGCNYDFERVKKGYTIAPSFSRVDRAALENGFIEALSTFRMAKALLYLVRMQQQPADEDSLLIANKEMAIGDIKEIQRHVLNRYEAIFFLLKFLKQPLPKTTSGDRVAEEIMQIMDALKINLSDYAKLESLPSNDEKIASLRESLGNMGYTLVDEANQVSEPEMKNGIIDEQSLGDRINYFKLNFEDKYLMGEVLEHPEAILEHYNEINKQLTDYINEINLACGKMVEYVDSDCPPDKRVDAASREGKLYLENPFPVIFLSKDPHRKIQPVNYEYRTLHEPLQLGEDIPFIATQRENVITVQQYLLVNQINNVQVVSFDALSRAYRRLKA